jgi:SAM-dependent methyltransferase
VTQPPTPPWVGLASDLGVRAVADGDPTRWYDELWSAAERGDVPLPWDHTDPNDVLGAYVAGFEASHPGEGRRAVVIGCGLGADSEYVAAHGWATTAFDISPAAVAAVRERYPDSPVDYRVANLLDLPHDLVGAFDLVVEIFTIQALHPSLRGQAIDGVRRLIGPGGTALVVQFVRADDQAVTTDPPWLLTRAEIEELAGDGVEIASLEVLPPAGNSRFDNGRWGVLLTRP